MNDVHDPTDRGRQDVEKRWQGAAWFLFALMLVTLSFPAMAA
ncbi:MULTISPECIES: hypothetical protein [Gordonia]|uniref:Uncharacterized protein n=1 Tax=Gordonia amicalis TaxID=89053 RepID=A0AAE4R507_9ACTN|nr:MULTISPECIES: hypothetical protein [Gordonia]MCZ4581252.1 hypothetical protein [Gordonia amicalis]MDJ0453595.1 hypothetical protein [Gordonia amicalis]MDV6308454.1 hypothetical protein [Gordonia amicalis]MDV6313448.1 hypothetical protein [Gordonia amicalis]MDV7077495.1 hypothetical protein [Gordonia amicalis]